jgi:transposase-like protein
MTGEVGSAQTVSQLSRDLDRLVKQFHEARLKDEWVYLFLDGVSLRVRRPSGRKRVQMLLLECELDAEQGSGVSCRASRSLSSDF